jgi:hypothetical protein
MLCQHAVNLEQEQLTSTTCHNASLQQHAWATRALLPTSRTQHSNLHGTTRSEWCLQESSQLLLSSNARIVEVSVQRPGDSALSYLQTVRCQPQGQQYHGTISLQASTSLPLLGQLRLQRTEPVLCRTVMLVLSVLSPVTCRKGMVLAVCTSLAGRQMPKIAFVYVCLCGNLVQLSSFH